MSLKFDMLQPTEGDGYRIVACDLLQAVEVLSHLPNISSRGCALIAAHTLECILKAFLWHKGKQTEIPRQDRHNLKALWEMAHKEDCLVFLKILPNWVDILSTGHGPNFYFRYQEGEKSKEQKEKNIVHGGATPELIPMANELKNLIEKVNLAIIN